jgi:hypothetical protein
MGSMARVDHDPVPIEVVALIASAEDLPALRAILLALPHDLAAAVLVLAHPVDDPDAVAAILDDQLPLPAGWVEEGSRVAPGHVLVCPPGRALQVSPDQTCALTPAEPDADDDRAIERLLASLVDRYGPRAMAVLLRGTADAGVEGTHALALAGGTVIVHPDDTVAGETGPDPSPESVARAISGIIAGTSGSTSLEHLSPELRTPLTLLLATLEGALRRDDVPDGLRHELAVSARRARRLQRLMDTLLDLSAREHERLGLVAATDAYRVALTDTLRALGDPSEIQAVASTMLARHLGVHRAYYAGPEKGGLVRVHRDAHGDLPSLAGIYRLTDFGDDLIDGLYSNKTLIIHDIAEIDLDPSVRAAWESTSTAAVITVPSIRDGSWLGTLTVAHQVPRRWTDAEVALVEETAERTWAAIDRANAEEALRAAQDALRLRGRGDGR